MTVQTPAPRNSPARKYDVKCDACKSTIRGTDSLHESAAGGLCSACKPRTSPAAINEAATALEAAKARQGVIPADAKLAFDPAWVAKRIDGIAPGMYALLLPTAPVLTYCAAGIIAGTLDVSIDAYSGRLKVLRVAAPACPMCGGSLARMYANAAPSCPNGCSDTEHHHDRAHRHESEDAAREAIPLDDSDQT